MDVNTALKKYGLTKSDDCWKHPQGNFYILTHDACLKIAQQENISTEKIECLQCTATNVTLLVTMAKDKKTESTIGEASKDNVKMQGAYLGCMAEKRGKDRAILQLINCYEFFKSEEETEQWEMRNLGFKAPSEAQIKYMTSLCVQKNIDNSKWDVNKIPADLCSKLINDLKNNKGENVNKIMEAK